MSTRSEQARDEVIQVLQEGINNTVMSTISTAHQHRFDSIAVEFVDGSTVILRIVDVIER